MLVKCELLCCAMSNAFVSITDSPNDRTTGQLTFNTWSSHSLLRHEPENLGPVAVRENVQGAVGALVDAANSEVQISQ